MLTRLKDSLSMKARRQLADSLVISKLTYLICLWGNTTTNQQRRAQVCQNIAARFVTGDRKSVSMNTLMSRCNWLDVRKLTEYYSLVQLCKAT